MLRLRPFFSSSNSRTLTASDSFTHSIHRIFHCAAGATFWLEPDCVCVCVWPEWQIRTWQQLQKGIHLFLFITFLRLSFAFVLISWGWRCALTSNWCCFLFFCFLWHWISPQKSQWSALLHNRRDNNSPHGKSHCNSTLMWVKNFPQTFYCRRAHINSCRHIHT